MPFENLLSKLSVRNCRIVEEKHGKVFHVCDPHALIQASGYLKFVRSKNGEGIFYRGQPSLYPSLAPTLFREIGKRQAAQSNKVQNLKKFISEITAKCEIFSQIAASAHEPLLQHYGLSTTWLDLVDNIWVALWFACHNAHISGKRGEYLHFERREPRGDVYAYIVLVAADVKPTKAPGIYKGSKTELVDLRVACPSIFLRPHAQHGVLFRMRGVGVSRPVDYSSQIRAVVRIYLGDALSWLGDAKTLGAHALFPPPYYDHGYKLLLDQKFENNNGVGAIHLVGA